MNFLEFLGVTWLALIAWNFFVAYKKEEKDLTEVRREIIQDEVDRLVKEVYVDVAESDGQKYYLVYDAKTNNYIAQGRDREEIKANIEARYPNTVFIINNDNLDKITG